MEIGDLSSGTGAGLHRPQAHNWGWLKRSYERQTSSLSQQISQALYGLNLEMAELMEYRLRLSQALQMLQDIREPFEAPSSQLIVPRENRIFQVGTIAWQPVPVQQGEPFCATPKQVFEARRLAKIHQFIADEEAGFSHQVTIKMKSGGTTCQLGFDEVRLSLAGNDALRSGQDVPVKTLRMPPRFHRQVDFLNCARSA